MKQKKLAPLLSLTMIFELIMAPLAVHAEEKKEKGMSTAEVFNTGINFVGNLYQAARGQQMSPHMAGDMAAFQQQMTPQPDKFFNSQKLSKIPGLGQYLAMNNINPQLLDCKTLPTTMHEAKNEVCQIGITSDKNIPPTVQLNEMFTYYNQYTQINKTYRNYTADSNAEGQLFGVGCMKNAMQILSGFFQYRLNELDKLTTNLEAINNKFREASRSDLDAIEEATAVLEGGDSNIANKVKTKRPDLFDYAKRFDNPACKSMMSSEKFNELGASGLNAINKNLKKSYTGPAPGSKFSGESYGTNHASIVEEINKLADKVARQMELNFSSISGSNKEYSDAVKGMGGLSSSHNLSGAISADLFSDVQTKFSERNEKLKSQLADVYSELGDSASSVAPLIRNPNSGAFDSEIATIETGIKNRCLNRSISVDELMSKIYDPSASKFANKNSSNFLKDKLKQILENNRTSLEKKLAEIQALESQEGSRYLVKMQNSYEIQEVDTQGKLVTKVVGASNNRTPGAFIGDIIKNCEAQYKVNHLGNKMSGATAIQKLKSIHQEYKSLAKTHAQDAREAIKKGMIECNNSADANNQIIGSCSNDAFNTSTPGFCANKAISCSKNMQACSQQAEKFVTDIKKERTSRVNNYKNLIQKNKQDIVKIFDTALAQYMKDGELLRGTFGVGFTSPSGIQREVPEGSRYLDEFKEASQGSIDGSLLLEDPEKYVTMFKSNIDNLKQKVKEQQDQILGAGGRNAGGLLADHIRNTQKNYDSIIGDSEQFAQKCHGHYSQFISKMEQQKNQQQADHMKKMSELGEKRQNLCNRISLYNDDPHSACSGNIQETVISSLAATQDAEAQRVMREFSANCKQYNQEKNSSFGADDICETSEVKEIQDLCKARDNRNSESYKHCQNASSTNSSDKTINISTCYSDTSEALDKKIMAKYRSTHRVSSSNTSDSGDAAAYCMASHNGGRESGKSGLLLGIDAFGKALSGKALGTLGQ